MALAVGTLRNVTAAELMSMDQQQAEAWCEGLHLLGLLVLSNHLHHASKDTISKLQNRSASICPETLLFAVLNNIIVARLIMKACELIQSLTPNCRKLRWLIHDNLTDN